MSHFPSDCSPHASLVPTQTAAASFPPPPQETFLEKHNVKLGFMSVFVKAAAHALQVRLGLEGLAGRVAVAMGVRPQAPCAGALHSAWRDCVALCRPCGRGHGFRQDGQSAAGEGGVQLGLDPGSRCMGPGQKVFGPLPRSSRPFICVCKTTV